MDSLLEKRKVLITGASGCIGSNLVARYLEIGYDVNILIRNVDALDKQYINRENLNIFAGDINKKNIIEKASSGCEVIFHLAARVHHYEDKPFKDYKSFETVNVDGTRNLLDANIENKFLKKFIFFSSAGVNNEAIDTSYLKSKFVAEKLCLEYFAKYNMPIVILRPALVFGENDRGNFYKMMDAVYEKRFFIIGDGNNKKSMIYVENLINYIILIADSDKSAGKIYNIADKNTYSLNYITELLSKYLGVKKPYRLPKNLLVFIAFLWEMSLGNISSLNKGNMKNLKRSIIKKLTESNIIDINFVEKEYPEAYQVPFEDAIIKTVKWYKSNIK